MSFFRNTKDPSIKNNLDEIFENINKPNISIQTLFLVSTLKRKTIFPFFILLKKKSVILKKYPNNKNKIKIAFDRYRILNDTSFKAVRTDFSPYKQNSKELFFDFQKCSSLNYQSRFIKNYWLAGKKSRETHIENISNIGYPFNKNYFYSTNPFVSHKNFLFCELNYSISQTIFRKIFIKKSHFFSKNQNLLKNKKNHSVFALNLFFSRQNRLKVFERIFNKTLEVFAREGSMTKLGQYLKILNEKNMEKQNFKKNLIHILTKQKRFCKIFSSSFGLDFILISRQYENDDEFKKDRLEPSKNCFGSDDNISFEDKVSIFFDFSQSIRRNNLWDQYENFNAIFVNPDFFFASIKSYLGKLKPAKFHENNFLSEIKEKFTFQFDESLTKIFGETRTYFFYIENKILNSKVQYHDHIEECLDNFEFIRKNKSSKKRNEEDIMIDPLFLKKFFHFFGKGVIPEKIKYSSLYQLIFARFLLIWFSVNHFLIREIKVDISRFSYLFFCIPEKEKIFFGFKLLVNLMFENELISSKNYKNLCKNLRNFIQKKKKKGLVFFFLKSLQNLKFFHQKKNFRSFSKILIKKINSEENFFLFSFEQKLKIFLPVVTGIFCLGLKKKIFYFLAQIEPIRHKKLKNLISIMVIFSGFAGKKLNFDFFSLVFKTLFDLFSEKQEKNLRILKFFKQKKKDHKNIQRKFFNKKIKEFDLTFVEKKTKIHIFSVIFLILFFGHGKNFKIIVDIFTFLTENEIFDMKEIFFGLLGLLILSRPSNNFLNYLIEFSLTENLKIAKNAIFLLGIISIQEKNSKISNFLEFIIEFYERKRAKLFHFLLKNSKNVLKKMNSNYKSIVMASRFSQGMKFLGEKKSLIFSCIFSRNFSFETLILLISSYFLNLNFNSEGFSLISSVVFMISENEPTNFTWILDNKFRIRATYVKKKQ